MQTLNAHKKLLYRKGKEQNDENFTNLQPKIKIRQEGLLLN